MATNIITTLQSSTLNGITGSTMTIGNTLTTNNIQLGGDQTTGTITIGGTARTTGPINIGTGTTTAVPITIGGTGSSTTIGGTLGVTGGISANGGITMGSGKTITLGSVANDSSVYNTFINVGNTNQTVTHTLQGQTTIIYNSSNSAYIPHYTQTTLSSSTITNAGIYIVSYVARYSGTSGSSVATNIQTWLYLSSPSTWGGPGISQVGLNSIGYVSPYLNLNSIGACTTTSWTGLINAGATLSLNAFIQYTPTTGGTYQGFVLGGIPSNYMSITRLA